MPLLKLEFSKLISDLPINNLYFIITYKKLQRVYCRNEILGYNNTYIACIRN